MISRQLWNRKNKIQKTRKKIQAVMMMRMTSLRARMKAHTRAFLS